MEKQGVQVDVLRATDHDIAVGVWPDTEHGWQTDEWPQIFQQVMAADILVIAGRRHTGPRQPAVRVGRRLPVRLPEPRAPVGAC